MKLLDKAKFAVVAAPASIQTQAFDNTTYLLGDYIHMAMYNQCTFVILNGVTAATSTVNIYQATSAAGGSAKVVQGLSYRYTATATSAASDTWVKTAMTSTGLFTHPATNYTSHIIEVHASQLDLANSFEWVTVNMGATGTGSTLCAVLAILTEPRVISGEESGQGTYQTSLT